MIFWLNFKFYVKNACISFWKKVFFFLFWSWFGIEIINKKNSQRLQIFFLIIYSAVSFFCHSFEFLSFQVKFMEQKFPISFLTTLFLLIFFFLLLLLFFFFILLFIVILILNIKCWILSWLLFFIICFFFLLISYLFVSFFFTISIILFVFIFILLTATAAVSIFVSIVIIIILIFIRLFFFALIFLTLDTDCIEIDGIFYDFEAYILIWNPSVNLILKLFGCEIFQ